MLPMLLSATALAVPPLEFPSAPNLFETPTCDPIFVELGFVGDLMQHDSQLSAARRPNGYDYDGLFDSVHPWLTEFDWLAGNLETTIAGEDLYGYTGYPAFNSPHELLGAIERAGFDVLQTANNHSLDRGRTGILRTLDAVDGFGFLHSGTYRSAAEAARPWTMSRLAGDVDVALISYTYGTNPSLDGIEPWMIALIDDRTWGTDIAGARAAGADVVVVGVHWGKEYQHQPSPDMKAIARQMVELGADVVWGHHPHVLEPAEVITVNDGWSGPRDGVVMYSLGNFVSAQRGGGKEGGTIASVTVASCPSTGRAWVADTRFVPVWVDTAASGVSRYRVVPTVSTSYLCGQEPISAADCDRLIAFRTHAASLLPVGAVDAPPGLPKWTSWFVPDTATVATSNLDRAAESAPEVASP